MKFFHVADLHFGKMLHNVPLIEADQAFWVEQFLYAVDDYRPDAVVMAGDIYDRSIPSVEAMRLFAHLLLELERRHVYVFVIPGNHDSGDRLSYVNSLLSEHRIYIAGGPAAQMMHVRVSDSGMNVVFWLMPYIFPRAVADLGLTARDQAFSYDEAARAYLAAQTIDTNAVNVLIAHQNTLAHGVKPEHSDSETIIGGLGEIDYTAFDAFDYVALGHIHNAQAVGRETVRYAGCPLYYDFSETGRRKDLTLVTINSKHDIAIERAGIRLKHTLMKMEGTLDELLAEGRVLKNKDDYYIQCILRDRFVPPRALEQLREVYGDSLVNVKRDAPGTLAFDSDNGKADGGSAQSSGLSFEEQFSQFFADQAGELPDGVQESLAMKIIEQQERCGTSYGQKAGDISDEESAELLEYLERVYTGGEGV